MRNYNNKNKNVNRMSNKTKSILVTIGMILLIFALVAGVYTLINPNKQVKTYEGFELVDVTWKNNGIDLETGEFVIDKGYMYSDEIKCESTLKIDRDFVSGISYVVFYYDSLGHLVLVDTNNESKNEEFKGYTGNYEKDVTSFELEEGKTIDHARILLKWLENDDDKLNLFERNNLKKSIHIYVEKVSEVEEE